jgi:hypothetical protein
VTALGRDSGLAVLRGASDHVEGPAGPGDPGLLSVVRAAGQGARRVQTKALRPVMARPTIRVFISRVPS